MSDPLLLYEGMRIYTDGSTIGRNPSKIGGAYAVRVVAPDDTPTLEIASFLAPKYFHNTTITSNMMELYALILGINCVIDCDKDIVYSDSQVSIDRIKAQLIPEGIREPLLRRMLERLRKDYDLSRVKIVRVASHPTKAELKIGHRNGVPVSKHNVWCDAMCRRIADEIQNGKTQNGVYRLFTGHQFIPVDTDFNRASR